jgi:hypothetical protein
MIQIRPVVLEADHAMLSEWWTGHGAPVVEAGILPPIGFIAEHDGEPQAAVWMDFSNNRGAAVLLWWTTKPGLTPAAAFLALTHLSRHGEAQAVALGYGGLVAVAPAHGGLVGFLERMGFDAGAKIPHVHLVKFLPLNHQLAPESAPA